jgi:Neuraminidase (sialidase)
MNRTFSALFLALLLIGVTDLYAGQSLKALNTNAATDSNYDQRATMAHDGNGKWVACWDSWTSGTDNDILFAVSTDQGKNWTAPRTLNSNATTDSGQDALPRISYGNGRWMVVWASDSVEIGRAHV